MKTIVTIIGARPQIIKAAAISRVIRTEFKDRLKEIIVHTGQHYDENMSEVFFTEMDIPRPDVNLGAGGKSHAAQTAHIMIGLEQVLESHKTNCVLVYGDTNSTLAASIVAAKMHIPVVHVEAGLRSFNKAMPEEINRIMCDHVSTLLFSPTETGIENLQAEGIDNGHEAPYSMDRSGVFHCGDVMYDNLKFYSGLEEKIKANLEKLGAHLEPFFLCTIHRDHNTDNVIHLNSIFSALLDVIDAHGISIVLPMHPRTQKAIELRMDQNLRERLNAEKRLRIIPPVSYLEMIALEKNCQMIITDSGGVQKEAFLFQKPCVILREQTEWVELVENGNAMLAGADREKIVKSVNTLLSGKKFTWPSIFGDGKASQFICEKIIEHIP